MKTETIDAFIDEIFEFYESKGAEAYAGEKVSQLEHMLQTAQLASEEGYDNDVVLAAFFHDIGHLCITESQENQMNGYGTIDHETVGAHYLLGKGFTAKMAKLVQGHVKTKRYLVFKYHNYRAQLSEASLKTLAYQGGPMSQKEAYDFENELWFELHLKMREWDDKAKVVNKKTQPISYYKEMARSFLQENSSF